MSLVAVLHAEMAEAEAACPFEAKTLISPGSGRIVQR
ncbi:MAG: hypothetical protein ACI8W3_003166, partial [Myxococcota bacterium]